MRKFLIKLLGGITVEEVKSGKYCKKINSGDLYKTSEALLNQNKMLIHVDGIPIAKKKELLSLNEQAIFYFIQTIQKQEITKPTMDSHYLVLLKERYEEIVVDLGKKSAIRHSKEIAEIEKNK
jgi:hypothetical protein